MHTTHYIFIIASYLLGSVPFGVLVARALGKADPRKSGSGNIGATNVTRSLGKAAGAVTLLLDVAKGAVPTVLAAALFLDPQMMALAAFAALVGHLFPVFLGFKGGKGVATVLGITLAISPISGILCLVVFIVLVAVTRYVSLGSIVSVSIMPVFIGFRGGSVYFTYMAVAIAVLIIIKHSENIKRLSAGTENKIGPS
ncbi:MAG: glycerol-3-phosphate 1-O-acyltransferase PlsY [Thermodesulfobacteriota bacterium]